MQTKSMQIFAVIYLFTLSACAPEMVERAASRAAAIVHFGPEQSLGRIDKNPSTPFLRYAPDGRLFAVWSEDHDVLWPEGKHAAGHQRMSGDRAASPMRNVFLAWSADGGSTWSSRARVNSRVEAVQGEENGPKVAFGKEHKAYVVWSIPGAKGDKTRANVRFAMEDTRAAVTEYAGEAKLAFPIALDLNSAVKRAYRIFGPPATFFIDGQGVIRDVVVGPITAERARDALKKTGIDL